jgi:hypothetical protein
MSTERADLCAQICPAHAELGRPYSALRTSFAMRAVRSSDRVLARLGPRRRSMWSLGISPFLAVGVASGAWAERAGQQVVMAVVDDDRAVALRVPEPGEPSATGKSGAAVRARPPPPPAWTARSCSSALACWRLVSAVRG